MDSVWNESAQRIHFPELRGDMKTDVLIIGGGIAGILSAYMLRQAGVDCVLVEAGRICERTTGNTTAKITLGHGLIYDKLIRRFGYDKAKMYLEAQIRACQEYERLCQDIDCDYTKADSYVYSLDGRKKVENEILALNKLGVNAEFSDAAALPFDVAGAVRVSTQAQFHPLKFLYHISRELPIYENTKVLELKPGSAKTNHGEIKCEKIIVATHFPLLNKHGSYFLKMYQHRSYVVALKGADMLDGMYVDENDKGLSFRRYGEMLLLGGGGGRTGKKAGGFLELESFCRKYYPKATIVNRWATQDCMTLDGVPYIGQYSKSTPGMYVATGFNKWGMSSSMAAAIILSDLVCGRANEYASVFSPSRSMLRAQLACNAFESFVGLITPTVPRCPHLGCALKYNAQEHSWDCPCHGSRFSEGGAVIDNPATDDTDLK